MYALYSPLRENLLRIYHFGTGYSMEAGFFTPGSVIVTYKRDIVLPVYGIMRALHSYGYLKLKVAELTTTVVSPVTVYDTVTTTAVAQTTVYSTVTTTATVTVTTTQTVTQTTTTTTTVYSTVTTTATVTVAQTTVYSTVTTTTTEVLVVPQVRTVTVTTTTTKTAIGVVGLEPVTVALLVLAVLFVVLGSPTG